MLKKVTAGLCSICITLIMAVTSVTGSIPLQVYANTSQQSDEVSSKDKISLDLTTIMQESSADEKIPVWVWFTDIDQDKIDEDVEKDTGLTAVDVAVSYEDVPNELINALDDNFDENTNEQQVSQTFDILQTYVKNTDEQRTQEQINADAYINARRNMAHDAYVEQNCELIDELSLPKNEIIFQSQLTPSIIINLTKNQILTTAEAESVVSIDYYEQHEEVPPLNTRDDERSTMRADVVQKITGLTGKGINVIVFDHGWIRPDVSNYDGVESGNVQNVVNQKLYPVTELSVLPPLDKETSNHPNLVAGTMRAFAKDVNIFSVGYGEYADLEWAVLNCDIDLINGSINLSTYYSYSNDAPAKWLDALVSTHNITLIASGGNSKSWQSYGWPNVISPASGYNSIAVGAYYFNIMPNKMRDYRYNPIDSTEQVNYKPDIVVASPSTSEASPMVSGIVSMMIQLKPSLAANPELIKAILMASCHRKVESVEGFPRENMTDGLTQRQGAGAIDAYNAISIVLQGKYGVSEISSGTTDVGINESLTNGNINVSIAWLRNNIYTSTDKSSADLGTLQELELEVLDNNSNIVGMSARKNTGKQMVYFPASSNDGEYTIRVTKESQNNEYVRFAYAWSTDNEIIPIRAAVTSSGFDDIGSVLDGINVGNINWDTVPASVDLQTLIDGNYDVLFINCSSNADVDGEVIREFVEQGGTVYASDWALDSIEEAFPERNISHAVMSPQSVTGNIADKGLRTSIKVNNIPIEFDKASWRLVTSELQDDVTVYVEGRVIGALSKQYPLAFSFPYGNNGGKVFCTSFHQSANSSQEMNEFMKDLVLTINHNKDINAISEWSKENGYENVMPVTAALNSAEESASYSLNNIDTTSDFAILTYESGDVTINLTAPDGSTYTNFENGEFVTGDIETTDDEMQVYSMGKRGLSVSAPIAADNGEWSFKIVSNVSYRSSFAVAAAEKSKEISTENYTIDYRVAEDWGSGQNIQVTITNTGDELLRNWALQCDNFHGTVTNVWNGMLHGENIIRNAMYNSDIAPGDSVTLGYTLTNADGEVPVMKLCTFRKAKQEGYSVDIDVLSEWGSGFIGAITITNTTDEPIMAWELSFNTENFDISGTSQFVILENTDNRYKITGTYNGNIPIPANTSITMQFNGEKTGTPSLTDISLTEMMF